MESFVTVLWRHPRKSATSRSCRMMATDIKWLFGTFLRAWCSMVAFSIGPLLCNWNDTQKSAVNYPGGTQNPGLITIILSKNWWERNGKDPGIDLPSSIRPHLGSQGLAKSGHICALRWVVMSPPTSHEPTRRCTIKAKVWNPDSWNPSIPLCLLVKSPICYNLLMVIAMVIAIPDRNLFPEPPWWRPCSQPRSRGQGGGRPRFLFGGKAWETCLEQRKRAVQTVKLSETQKRSKQIRSGFW